MTEAPWPTSEDPVKEIIERANVLLAAGDPPAERVREVLGALGGSGTTRLVRFDETARSWYASGLELARAPRPARGARRRRHRAAAAPRPAQADFPTRLPPPSRCGTRWQPVSGDGHERERAVRAAPAQPLHARLVTIRCIDWVRPVRDAALARLDELPQTLVVELLALAAQLAAERERGRLLDAFLDARLTDADLRDACRSSDLRTRRAAWRRLAARGALDPDELRIVAARDRDVVVRAVAAQALAGLAGQPRRALAEVLVRDRVGWIAVPALAVLVELDGADAIRPALVARTAALRRAARDWASIREVDARAVYIERVAARPDDAVASSRWRRSPTRWTRTGSTRC